MNLSLPAPPALLARLGRKLPAPLVSLHFTAGLELARRFKWLAPPAEAGWPALRHHRRGPGPAQLLRRARRRVPPVWDGAPAERTGRQAGRLPGADARGHGRRHLVLPAPAADIRRHRAGPDREELAGRLAASGLAGQAGRAGEAASLRPGWAAGMTAGGGGLTCPRRQSCYILGPTPQRAQHEDIDRGRQQAWAAPWPKGWGGRGNDHRRIAQGAHGPDGGAVLRAALDRADLSDPGPPPPHRRPGAGRTGRHSLQRRRVGDKAFTDDYDFLADSPQQIARLLDINITGTILLLQRLIPRLLGRAKPQLVLTGSTSGLPRSGRKWRSALQGGAVGHRRRAARALPRAAAGGHLPAAGLPEHRGRAGGGAR